MNLTIKNNPNSALACATAYTPIHNDVIRDMVLSHDREASIIKKVATFNSKPEHGRALETLLRVQEIHCSIVDSLFQPDDALKSLKKFYWRKLSTKTKIEDLMGAKDKKAFQEQMKTGLNLPDFTMENINSTLTDLYNQGETFFIDAVDEVFQRLSKDHVTNCPSGFRKRMIMSNKRDDFNCIDDSIINLVHDLRRIIARLGDRGKDDLTFEQTKQVFFHADNDIGDYIDVDNAFRLKTYLKGTCHIEINEHIADQLNEILAAKYPSAIPAPKRESQSKRSKRTAKKQVFIRKLLDFNVLESLTKLIERSRYSDLTEIASYTIREITGNNKFLTAQVVDVIKLLGAVKLQNSYRFAETRESVIIKMLQSVITNGYVPDYKTQQFYPTTKRPALKAVKAARIDRPGLLCLEPQAGQGGISQYLPADTVNVEINPLFCEFLTAKGFQNVLCEDFLKYSASTTARFDRIIMNPPFVDLAWLFHVEAALAILKNDGVLVAILPLSAKKQLALSEQYNVEFLQTFDNEFANTQVSVVVVRITIK